MMGSKTKRSKKFRCFLLDRETRYIGLISIPEEDIADFTALIDV
jgi:hypothetical protein